ncbi:hypothetical protein ACPYO6_09325 [Georgenia sp. Z1344]|uniref:hypothetical protein n=1 Tax=Georgenia sp. Z1344 TaxID=3416706 RepID=UPI003CF76B77
MRSMSRVLVVPAGMLALALTLGACSDGPSVSSRSPYADDPAPSAPSLPSTPPGTDPDADPSESPTEDGTDPADSPDGTETPSSGEAPTTDDEESTETPTATPDTRPEDPTEAPSEAPTAAPTEAPTSGEEDEPVEQRPGGQDIRAAAGAALSAYPGAALVSVVHRDDNSGEVPPPDTGYVVVLVAGPDRVEVSLDSAYGVVGAEVSPADTVLRALAEEDVISADTALDQALASGLLEGEVVRSIELVSFSGALTWDIHVFGTSERVASIAAEAAGSEESSSAVPSAPGSESPTD